MPYIVQTCFRISGRLDVARFEESWHLLLARHDALRAVFVHEQSRPLQVVVKERRCDFTREDLRSLSPAEQDRRVGSFTQHDRARAFDLASDVLLRVRVFERAADSFDIVETHHHIILDGWSTAILYRELGEIYAALTAGRQPSLPEAAPFAQFIKWLDKRDGPAVTRSGGDTSAASIGSPEC